MSEKSTIKDEQVEDIYKNATESIVDNICNGTIKMSEINNQFEETSKKMIRQSLADSNLDDKRIQEETELIFAEIKKLQRKTLDNGR